MLLLGSSMTLTDSVAIQRSTLHTDIRNNNREATKQETLWAVNLLTGAMQERKKGFSDLMNVVVEMYERALILPGFDGVGNIMNEFMELKRTYDSEDTTPLEREMAAKVFITNMLNGKGYKSVADTLTNFEVDEKVENDEGGAPRTLKAWPKVKFVLNDDDDRETHARKVDDEMRNQWGFYARGREKSVERNETQQTKLIKLASRVNKDAGIHEHGKTQELYGADTQLIQDFFTREIYHAKSDFKCTDEYYSICKCLQANSAPFIGGLSGSIASLFLFVMRLDGVTRTKAEIQRLALYNVAVLVAGGMHSMFELMFPLTAFHFWTGCFENELSNALGTINILCKEREELKDDEGNNLYTTFVEEAQKLSVALDEGGIVEKRILKQLNLCWLDDDNDECVDMDGQVE